MRLILEGLTGTGKTQTIAAMRRLGRLPPIFEPEEKTFGDVMDEIASGGASDAEHLLRRLRSVLGRLAAAPGTPFLLERFHPSYYALLPTWSLYEAIDEQLAAMGASIVLLTVAAGELRDRCLWRREHGGADWQDFATRFGSEQNALDALRVSQERRVEVLRHSRLPSVTIDTSQMAWEGYALSMT